MGLALRRTKWLLGDIDQKCPSIPYASIQNFADFRVVGKSERGLRRSSEMLSGYESDPCGRYAVMDYVHGHHEYCNVSPYPLIWSEYAWETAASESSFDYD